MRANLARHGRRLLFFQARASSCSLIAARPFSRRRPSTPVACRHSARRTFMSGFFQKPPREVRQPEYEPGWMQIMVWRSRIGDSLRAPPRKELLTAFQRLLEHKSRKKMPFNSTQALQCQQLLEYLDEPSTDPEGQSLSPIDLSRARQILVELEPHERSQNHLKLAKSIHALWSSTNFGRKPRATGKSSFLVRSMCEYGGSLEALKLLQSEWDDPEVSTHLVQNDRLLEVVARGLSREGLETELVDLVRHAETRGIPYYPGIQAIVVDFFARQEREAETRYWFEKATGGIVSPRTYRTVASFAMRNNLQDWAATVFLELGQSQPRKSQWDVLLQAILLSGRSIEEVDTTMSHMVDRCGEMIQPDMRTINGLMGAAVEMHDVALGEAVLALAVGRGLEPDGKTYLALSRLHLLTGNLAAAQEAYGQVDRLEPWTNDTSQEAYPDFRRLTNEYLVALCAQPRPDFKHISSVLESVDERQMRLDPSTVAALSLRFLDNDQHFEVMDLLAAYSFLYSEHERAVMQDALISFCLDYDKTSTSRAWAAYQLLYQFFEDTSRAKREALMQGFFARKRADLAAQVFGHMRAHRDQAYHPRTATYILCLEGFAQHPDAEGLEMVHNMLKMDTFVQPSTRLNTALMLAYTASDRPLLALDFWHEITRSREGPSYASLEAVFWALERRPGGFGKARDIWDRVERMDLEMVPGVYNAYIGAVAGSGHEKEVRGLIMKMASFVGEEPGVLTLGIAYNALPGQELQKGFEEWAKIQYGETWTELCKVGRRMNEYSLCQFLIKRIMRAG